MEILLATKNENKIKEILALFNESKITFITLSELKDNDNVVESGVTFKDNALIKAKHYALKYQKITLSDDSGLEVLSLNKRPGVFSSRYANTLEEANKKLLRELEDKRNKKARFVSVLCLYNPFNKKVKYYNGILKGKITDIPRGENGFGYDPIFLLKNNKTLAEISIDEKNKISHRSIALEKFKKDIKKFL